MTLQQTAQALGASFREGAGPSSAGAQLARVSIDSRTIGPGDCFVAIKGTRFDGHDFVDEALERGAGAIIHSGDVPSRRDWPERAFLKVGDTTAALQALAETVRRRWGRRVVAITGSMGKTTVRQFAASLLGRRYEVLQSPGNLNNQYGVPLTLLQLEERHQRAVIELGMNHAGEIRELCRISRPDAAVITNVAAVHLEFFPDVDAIARAKGEILENLGQDGLFVFNADDHRVVSLAEAFKGKKLSFALREKADARVPRHRIESLQSMTFDLELHGRIFKGAVPFAGRHFLYNLAAACAVALGEGLEPKDIAAGIKELEPPRMRGRVIRFKPLGQDREVTVLDDSYNSNPAALRLILDTIRQLSSFDRRIVALGAMLELGPAGADLHLEAGRFAAGCGIDWLVTIGDLASFIRQGALEAGFAATKARHFGDLEQAGEFLARELRPGDLLAVKGSRGAGLDRLIGRILPPAEGRTE